MASKFIATPALLLLAMVMLMPAASAHAQAPAPAPAPSQSLCPNGFSNIQAFETAARALVDKVEMIFLPNLMVLLDSTLAELGLLHPSVQLCVCGPNPHHSRSSMEPKIKCFGGKITL
ncbi:hypothetical protein PAHAL_9G530700 [Panicum hallii]|jgi:hypothetical protein|uniref:Hydrophobic seed protein domain-containing protein n=1 Tax=Panicum hallii TaxID=206008 RepID=A0A2S3ISB4_9POAL|nr:hypothetical protein PAHAL_9G530700 [Panicum hallii]